MLYCIYIIIKRSHPALRVRVINCEIWFVIYTFFVLYGSEEELNIFNYVNHRMESQYFWSSWKEALFRDLLCLNCWFFKVLK